MSLQTSRRFCSSAARPVHPGSGSIQKRRCDNLWAMSEDRKGPREGPQTGDSANHEPDPLAGGAKGDDPSEAYDEPLVKTAELLAKTGISRQVLYRYMQLDLVVPAKTTESGRNYFSPRVFMILDLIERLKSRGYTLRDIKDIVGEKMASAQRDEDDSEESSV